MSRHYYFCPTPGCHSDISIEDDYSEQKGGFVCRKCGKTYVATLTEKKTPKTKPKGMFEAIVKAKERISAISNILPLNEIKFEPIGGEIISFHIKITELLDNEIDMVTECSVFVEEHENKQECE